MKSIITMVLLNFATLTFGQSCDCEKALKNLENEYELNLASYQHQVIQYKRQAAYQEYKKSINLTAKKINNIKDCIGLVSKYQAFFRDEHLFIDYDENFYKFNSLKDTVLIKQSFYNDDKIINEDTESVFKNLEGVWYFQDGTFAVNIIPNKSFNREYAAIFINDYSPFWFKGQIKMEFSITKDKTLYCIYWRNKRTPKFMKAVLQDSVLAIGKEFRFYRNKEQALTQKSTLSKDFEFKQLGNKTTYLRIPSFDVSESKLIDSLVKSNLMNIKNSPNLIIDVRDNGGGGDRSYQPLLPLIFNTKIIPNAYTASVWVSKGNLKYYDSTKFETAETKEDSLSEIKYVAKLRPFIGKFEPIKFSKDTLDFIYGYPQKIAILTNKRCASSTEGFVLVAKESKKVLQFGENTGGTVSYGDWRKIKIPGLPIWVSCTTKRMSFFNGQDIESIGIKPNVELNPLNENNWINEVQKYLEK